MNIRTKVKKAISVFMGAVMVITLFCGMLWAKKEAEAADYGIADPVTEDGVTTWDTVYFGNYYQSNSETKEPIRWRVLSVEGDDAFLLADKCLDCKKYNVEDEAVTWETCTLRTWLNDDFYNAAFDSGEQAAVIETDVENHNHPYYGTEGGNDTKDKVYLLSLEEIINTKYGFSKYINKDTETRQAVATEYAKQQGASPYDEGKAYWWCRSGGDDRYHAAYVDIDGYGCYSGGNGHPDASVVRPALHLNLTSDLWKKGDKVSAGGADVSSEDKTPVPEITPNPVHGLGSPVTEDGVTTWDTVYFGNYYQSNSGTKEPIRWRVLSVEGDDAFLLADKCLNCKKYNEEYEDVTWETCTLRTWLNDDFYNAAFGSGEQAAVIETDVENHNNPYYGTEGGNDTKDKVYLLSLEEIINTKYGFSKYINKDTGTRQAAATEYAKEPGAWTNSEGKAYWWCRSCGASSRYAAYVGGDGGGLGFGFRVSDDGNNAVCPAVRPALHLNLTTDLWKKGDKVSSDGGDIEATPVPKPTDKPETAASPVPKPTDKPETAASPVPKPTDKPEATASPAPKPTAQPAGSAPVISAGYKIIYNNATYTVISTGEGSQTVAYTAPGSKKAASVTIPKTIAIKGVSYKVTEIADNAFKGCSKLKKMTIGKNITRIGKNAFAGCSKLKTITIKSKVIRKIGKKALSGINKKATIKIPKKQYASYKKLLKKAGLPKSVKIKKY